MKEKHIFAGNNTSHGFFSYFDYLISPEDATRIYLLKGGPGVGKSSFMKKFGTKMQEINYSVEYVHCSSDNDSLDGIIIPELKVAFLDGTAPHTIDPIIPGAVDEIINLGSFLDHKQLDKHKSQIIQINKTKSNLYKSAYRFFECAGLILEEINSFYDQCTDNKQFQVLCEEVIDYIFHEGVYVSEVLKTEEQMIIDKYYNNYKGSMRKLFSEAYTANGYIKYTKSICEGKNVWAITGENMNYSAKLLDNIVSEALKKGYHIEGYYYPLNPEKLQHVYITELNTIVVNADKDNNYKYDKIINLSQIINQEKLEKYKSEIEINTRLYDLLIKTALEKLSLTKKEHELLEAYYKESMDFTEVDNYFNKLITQYN